MLRWVKPAGGNVVYFIYRQRRHGFCAGCRTTFAGNVAGDGTAFVLGAVAGFVSILLGRMTTVLDRIRGLNEIADDDAARSHSGLIFRACGGGPNS